MTPGHERIPFFVDQNVPESVGKVLEAAKHDVVRLREVMATDTADALIAVACAEGGQVLVTCDRDFRPFRRRSRSRSINITATRPAILIDAVQAPDPLPSG